MWTARSPRRGPRRKRKPERRAGMSRVIAVSRKWRSSLSMKERTSLDSSAARSSVHPSDLSAATPHRLDTERRSECTFAHRPVATTESAGHSPTPRRTRMREPVTRRMLAHAGALPDVTSAHPSSPRWMTDGRPGLDPGDDASIVTRDRLRSSATRDAPLPKRHATNLDAVRTRSSRRRPYGPLPTREHRDRQAENRATPATRVTSTRASKPR
jgi:hypothetical protein